MILRLLLLVAFAYGIYYLLRRAAATLPGAGTAKPKAQEFMVTCAHCGVHLPQSDSVDAGGKFYCGEEHRVAGPRQG